MANRILQPLSRFLLRNAARFGSGDSTLCINPPCDLPWRNLQTGQARIRLFTQDYADYLRLKAAGAALEFGAFPPTDDQPPGNVLLSMPREKERLEMWLAWCAQALPRQGRLWLAGENRAGVRSAGKRLVRHFGEISKLDNARHCALYECSAPVSDQPFSIAQFESGWAIDFAGRELQLISYPGVFSHGSPDPGTKMLLDVLAKGKWSGKVLDFGCGNGVLGACLMAMDPTLDVTLLDTNALALSAARATLERNGFTASVIASDGFSDIRGRFDLVVSNPPFHRGHVTQTRMSMGLLEPVRNFLNPGGQLLLVANRHLPYRRWLDRTFGEHRVLAADGQFHVLHAVQS